MTNTWLAGDMNCDNVVDANDASAFQLALQGRAAYEAQYPNCNWLNADIDGDVDSDDNALFTNLMTTGNTGTCQHYTWDGENRLSGYEPTFPTTGSQKFTSRGFCRCVLTACAAAIQDVFAWRRDWAAGAESASLSVAVLQETALKLPSERVARQ